MSGAVLVQFSSVDLRKLLPIGRQGLDRNLADAADAVGVEPPLHHMLCIAALKNPSARTADQVRPYMNLFHAGFVVACDERDCAEILELAGMPSIMVEAVERGTSALFLSGSLTQWHEAVMRGCQPDVGRDTRQVYNAIYTEFKNMGLAGLFTAQSRPHNRDHTFLLDHKS